MGREFVAPAPVRPLCSEARPIAMTRAAERPSVAGIFVCSELRHAAQTFATGHDTNCEFQRID